MGDPFDVAQGDTIAAIATALGEAGIGIVRLSGPEALAIADRLFRAGASGTASAGGSHRA